MHLQTVTYRYGGTRAFPAVVMTLVIDEDDRQPVSAPLLPSERLVSATVRRYLEVNWRVYICTRDRQHYYLDSWPQDGLGQRDAILPDTPLYLNDLIIGGSVP